MKDRIEAIPEVMDYGEEIVRVGENLDVLPLKHEVENAGGDWHPSDVGVFGKHDGFPNTNSSNGSFHNQSEENQTSVDEINGNKEDERGTSPELSKDISRIEEETNTPRIESLPLIPEVHHIGNEKGEPLVEELYPHTNSDVKEVEDGTIPELLVPEILSGKEIDMEEVNEDVWVGAVEPSVEQETRMGEKYEVTEDMKYEEQEIITYRGRGLVEEGYQGNLPKDGLETENVMQAEELKEKDDTDFLEESKGVEEDEVNDLVEVATEPQISEGSSPQEKIDVDVAKDGDNAMENITWSEEVVSDITNVGDDSVNYLASADVSAKEDEIPGEDIPETRDDNADAIGDGISKEEEVQGDVIINDGLSKDRELTSTEMVTEETGLPEPEAPSNGDSVSHPETEQQCPNPEASLVKEGAKESEADLADTTGEITEQVTFKQDDAPMDSYVYREIINNNPDEDPSSGKPDFISKSYAEPIEEVNEAEDEGNRVTEKGTNTKREHDPVPELTQYEFRPNVPEEEFKSGAMASNGLDIVGEDDKSSGFVISEDVEEKSADVSFKQADTIPCGDDDVKAYFVKDDNADTTKEVTEERTRKTDYVSDPIETGEVVEEKPMDISFVQAATIPHGDDDVEAYFVKDDDADTTKEVTEESAKKTDDASGPLETDVPIVADSSEDFTLQETQGIHPEWENLPEASVPSSEEIDFVEKVAKNGNDNVTEYASEEVLSTIENQPLDVPSASLEVELESEETDVGEDVYLHPGVSPLTDAANEVSETQTVEALEVLEEKLDVHQRSAELDTEISSTVPEDSNIDEQVATNEDSNCKGTTAAATLPMGSKIQEEVVESISALELDEAPKPVEVLEKTETSAEDATIVNFEQPETEAGSKQLSEIADQGDTTLTEVPGEPIEQVAVDTALPSIDLQDSHSDDQSVSNGAPKYEGISAAEVVTKRETPEEDILIGSFSGDAEAKIGSSEFFETPKIQGIQEDIVHTEDVQDSVSGISNETLAGFGIANDKDSTDIVEKDLIDGTENDEKIGAEQIAVETKDISSKEASFDGELGTEVITNDQTAVVDQVEERKEILYSNDQKGDAIKYDTHSEIEDADDRQVSINEASVEQSTEKEAAVEVDTNVVSSAEIRIIDSEPTQISRSIDAESSEERNLSSTENIKSKDLNEEVAESEEIVDVKETSDEAPLVESAAAEESILNQSIGTETPHEPDTLLVPTEENEVKDREVQSSEVRDSFPGKQETDMEEEISRPEQGDLPSEIEKTQNLSAADGADITETAITLEGDIQEAESRELSTSDLTNEAEHDENKVQEDDSFRLANTGPAANEVPEIPLEDSTLSEEHQPVEEPAVSQGDKSSSLMEDNNNEEKKGIVRPSEFLDETDSILEIKTDTAHFEDVQDGDTGIIDETVSGSVIAKDWDSTDIAEKELIDGTKKDEKISTGEAALETNNIDSREVEQDEQLVGESSGSQVGISETPESELSFEVERGTGVILSDQTAVADQTEEERKEILDSDDQNGKAIEYTTPSERADSDNHQTKTSEALVEETKEEKATVEFDSNGVSGTETGAFDTESTQISQGIVTESFEESNPTTDNVESKDLTEEVTETEEIINEKETYEDAAFSHSEVVESAVAEENIYDESTRKETSHERDSLLVPPEEIEVKDREAPSGEVPDSFSEKQEINVEQEVSRPEQTDFVSSEVETNQIFSKAEDVDLTVSTITPGGDNREAETREVNTSDQTKEEERAENKIQEDDSYGIANTDLRASEDAEIPVGGSAISEQHQYVEEPVLSQGDTDASLVDENINKDERDAVGSSEFRDVTNSVKMTKEGALQTEDIQNIESDIINETPAGTGLAEDKGSAETVVKDVINGTESEAKVDSGEVASETTNIDTREVEQYEQQVREVASDLQVGSSGTPEAEPIFEVEQVTGVIAADQTVALNQTAEESREILDSDDQNGEATKYTAHGETADADDRRASINEDLVEQTAEEKSVVEVESNVISGTETSTIDTASAQISRNIDAESFEERNSTAGNIENKEFFVEEGKYNDESKDQAEEVTKSEEIFDAKETSKEAALANSELVETAVAEEGILDQSIGTKISHEHDSSLVLPEESEAKDREVPSGVGSDDSGKQEEHVEERDLLALEFEKTQTAEIPELSTPDLTKDEVSVENRVETLESEGIRGLPIEDDQREDTQGVFVEEVAPEKEITSKDAEADRIIQEDETGHKEAENSIEAKEDEANKDGELKDVDGVDTESSVIVEETVAAATPATEKEDLENKDTPFSERSISDIPPGIQGEILDGENAGELNSAAVSVEDIAGKEEALVDSESREVEAIGQTEVSDEAALPNAPLEPATTLQTQPTDDSYQKDSVEHTEENKVNIDGETADDSMIESYGENEREVRDMTSDEQSSQVQIDCNDLGADAQTRDVPATAENAKIDQFESVEKATRSSDIGELEQIQSRDLQDQVDNSVPPAAEDGGNESTEVLLNEVETKEGSLEEAQQFAQSAEITSDEPSDQTSDLSASVADVVLEKEIHETVPSENNQMSRTIQVVSEYTDVEGVAAVDTEADIVKAAQPTESADDLTKEDIGQMSATVVPDENDNSKEQSSTADNQTTTEKSLELTDRQVEPCPGGEAELVVIEDIKSASIGESPLDQNPPAEVSQESALLQVSEKELGNEVVQSSATNEVWDYGNEPTVQTDISQDDLDIGTAKYGLGDRDFASAVQEKEILTEEDTSKIEEVVSEDTVESIDDNIREAAPTNSDTQLSMSSEILDGENAGEHNSAVVSVEDRCKEEGTDAGIEEISKEFSNKSVLSDITNEVAMRIQTEQADDSYEPDSTELAKESKLHVESMPVDGSTIEFYRENDRDIKDETSHEPVLIDNQELAVIQETTENVEIDEKVELDEHTTSAVVGEVEQYQGQELNASEEAFLQANQIDSSLPSEAKAGANKAENKEALIEEGLSSDGPSNQISTLSTGAWDNVHEPKTREVVTSEDDQAKGNIEELDDESRNRVEQEDIADIVEQEFPSNEERPVIGVSVEETKPLDELTQSIEEESNDCKGGENVSEDIKDVYTDIGVAAADTEEGVEEATQPTQSMGEEERIRETSTSITPDENDDLEKGGFVEPTPREEAMLADIVDVTPASVGESITEFSKEEPTLLHVSEKDAGNEDVQPVVMNDAWSVGTEPMLESDVGQDESYTGGSKSADKERDIKATQLELGDRDFIPAVPTKEILEVDASKIEEVESLGAGVAADEEAQEDSGHAVGKTKDGVKIYEDESSASESIINAETIIPHGEAEVSKSEDDTTEEVILRTSDDSSAVPEKVDVLGAEIECEKEVSSLGISQRNLPDVTNLEDTNVKEITMDMLSTDGQAVPVAASEETVAEKIHFTSDTDGNTDGEKTILPLPLEEREEAPGVKRVEETGTGDDTAEKYIESRNLDFMSAQADQETQSEINVGETLSDGYLVDKADYELESAAVEIAEQVEPPVRGTEEEAFGKDQMLLEKALENKDEYKIGAAEEGKIPILSEANDSVEKIVDPIPLEKAEEQSVDGIEGNQTDIKAENPIPNVQGSSKEIFKGDQTRTLEESKGTNRAILSERDAPTAYQDAGPQEVVSPAKEFTQDLPGTMERGLPPVEATESGDQSEVKLPSKEFEGEKYEPGNLQLPEEHEYDDHEHVEHSDAAPLISESSKETLDGKSHKKSHHNLLSGMSSKVKSSISKVKKVITGKSSSHGKDHSPKHGQ
ncbi:hypothetical protein MLD38_001379 [Melastoma candidum]|uniref:Uncharacterized protein n=1 Tax=Melastoma candidum TaxID=119954 RepID=A0ACB9SHY9_9MYRT|nr:hypothetical protein MLD38_001379 [Melastoma candidum]